MRQPQVQRACTSCSIPLRNGADACTVCDPVPMVLVSTSTANLVSPQKRPASRG